MFSGKYLETKEGSLERAVEEAMIEKHVPGHVDKPKLPRQLKDPKKEKMVGTKSGTKVVDKGDPKYKGAPEHESVDHPDMGDHDEKDEVNGKLKGRKSFKQFQKKDKEDQDKDPVGKKQDDLDRDDEAQATRSKKRPTAESDKPEQGKVYALTGKSNEPSIARGDSWKKSVVKKKPAPIKTAGMATKPLKSVFAKKEEVELDEELPVGHRSPSPGSDSTGSYAKMQDAKRKAKAAGKDYDRLSYGDQQKYHEEVEIDDTTEVPVPDDLEETPELVYSEVVVKPGVRAVEAAAAAGERPGAAAC